MRRSGRTLVWPVVLALVAVGVLGGLRLAASSGREAGTERIYQVTLKFWRATVAEVPTIAVTNLPDDLIAYEGDTLVITVKNESPLPEGFSIDALSVREVLQPNEVKTIRVGPVRAGAYPIYCQLHPFSVHYPGTLLVLPRPES